MSTDRTYELRQNERICLTFGSDAMPVLGVYEGPGGDGIPYAASVALDREAVRWLLKHLGHWLKTGERGHSE